MLEVTYCYPDSGIKTTIIKNDRSLLATFMHDIEAEGGAIMSVKNERKGAYLHNRAFYFIHIYGKNRYNPSKIITAYGKLSCERICRWVRDEGYCVALQRVRRNGSYYIPARFVSEKTWKKKKRRLLCKE